MPSLRNSLAVLAAFAVVLLSSCSSKSSTTRSTPSAEAKHDDRKPAPDFALKDANGNDVKLSDYRGRTVLLNFWATWCGPCNLEIPWFIDFEQQYKSKGFEVVGVSMDTEGWSVIKPYLTTHKINYRILLGDDSVSQLYGGVDSLPTSFIIDRNGKVAFVHVGLAGKNEYASEIQSVIDGKSVGTTRASLWSSPALLAIGPAE